jgi:hypothetical protein
MLKKLLMAMAVVVGLSCVHGCTGSSNEGICDKLDLVFEGGACTTSDDCPNAVHCDCDAPYSDLALAVCHPEKGCLRQLGCTEACPLGDTAFLCAQGLDLCASDEGCSGGKCVSAGSVGTCTTGETGESCYIDDHCHSGICLAAEHQWGRCSAGSPGDDCLENEDCNSGGCRLVQGPYGVCE